MPCWVWVVVRQACSVCRRVMVGSVPHIEGLVRCRWVGRGILLRPGRWWLVGCCNGGLPVAAVPKAAPLPSRACWHALCKLSARVHPPLSLRCPPPIPADACRLGHRSSARVHCQPAHRCQPRQSGLLEQLDGRQLQHPRRLRRAKRCSPGGTATPCSSIPLTAAVWQECSACLTV